MTTPDTEGGDGPQHRSSVHIKLEHQGNLRMVHHGFRTIQTLRTSTLSFPKDIGYTALIREIHVRSAFHMGHMPSMFFIYF